MLSTFALLVCASLSTGSPVATAPAPIAETLAALEAALHPRHEDPAAARRAVAELQLAFADAEPRERRSIARGLEDVYDEVDPADPRWRTVALEAAGALGTMGAYGRESLEDLLDDEDHEEDTGLRRRWLLALGRTGEARAIRTLERHLESAEWAIQAAAAEALGEFTHLPQDERKEVFYSLLKNLLDAWRPTNLAPFDQFARHRYDAVVGPITTSLQRLSGHDERDPQAWQTYWNEHKRSDWDRPANER